MQVGDIGPLHWKACLPGVTKSLQAQVVIPFEDGLAAQSIYLRVWRSKVITRKKQAGAGTSQLGATTEFSD